ncbi:MAG: hypothetical protein ABIP78_04325 [Pyrinomonadaceae bacterium]
MKRLICTTTILLLASIAAFADIARPETTIKPTPKPKSVSASMTIRLDRNATEATLRIPKSQIKQLRAELEQMDDGSDNIAAVSGSFSRTQTIVSGVFLSLAFVFGGMWFVRSGKAATKIGKGLIILAAIAGIGSAATLVYANAGPPSEARSITGKMFSHSVHLYKFGYGKIKLETKADGSGEGIELIVPDPQPSPGRKYKQG